jgi:hypothetical protein
MMGKRNQTMRLVDARSHYVWPLNSAAICLSLSSVGDVELGHSCYESPHLTLWNFVSTTTVASFVNTFIIW